MSEVTVVHGYCPMGCGETLALASGSVVCRQEGCPCPDGPSRILSDSETAHIVAVDPEGFAIRHPLRERLDVPEHDTTPDDCDLHSKLRALGMHVKPGVYRATEDGGPSSLPGWRLEPIE